MPRLLITAACVAILVLCPACAIAPERWTITYKRQRNLNNGRPTQDEVDITLTGPIPTFRRHE